MHGAWRVSKVLCRENEKKDVNIKGPGEMSIGT